MASVKKDIEELKTASPEIEIAEVSPHPEADKVKNSVRNIGRAKEDESKASSQNYVQDSV